MSLILRYDLEIMKPRHTKECAIIDGLLLPESCYLQDDFMRCVTRSRCIVPLVAIASGSVVGFHLMMVRKQFVYGIRTVVEPTARFAGVGRAMHDYQAKMAHSKPCLVTIPDVDDSETAAGKQDFLRSCGYKLVRFYRGDDANPNIFSFRREPLCSRKST